MRPRFSPDGRSVLFLLEDRLNVHLARVPVAGGPVERVVGGDRVISAFDVGRKGEIVVLESQTDRPEEVSLVGPAGALKRLTQTNDEALAGVELAAVTRHEAKSADGTVVDYYLTRAKDASAGKRPAILSIHGGPVAQFQNEFDFEWQPAFDIVNHFTYAIVSDGDLMEGVARKPPSLAGHLQLGKLIYLYDDNHVTLAAGTDITFTEDRAQALRSLRLATQIGRRRQRPRRDRARAAARARRNARGPR